MRVYVPLTLTGLAAAHREGEVGGGRLTAYGVTPALREWYVSEDVEELEYAALGRAAHASLRLLADDPEAARRRVVLALDVPEGSVRPESGTDAEPGELRLDGPLLMRFAAAVHLDAADAEADVTAAAEALDAARAGDETARSTVDGAEDHELLWYAVQEIDTLL